MLQKLLPPICTLALCLFFNNNQITAQSKTPKYEVGAQFSLLRFSDLDITEPGFGGRFTYNINEHIAVEAEGNFFPREGKEYFGETLQGGRKTQGLFGVKAGARTRRLGIFGKVRPGFLHFGNFTRPGIACTDVCPPQPPPNFSQTDFALDLGSVIELYPSQRTILRFDIGDTMIHSGSGEVVVIPGITQFPSGFSIPFKDVVRSTSHNLQFSVGIGFRF
ncbi:MAG: outer membrane beta-barrel protein [Acidobacteriota bacterium]